MLQQKKLTRNLALCCLLWLSIILIDQGLKAWIVQIPSNSYIENAGLMAGAFSNQNPELLRILATVGLSSLLLVAWVMVSTLNQIELWSMSRVFSLFIGAITSNGIDRLIRGSVVDFMVVRVPLFSDYVINLSDVFILICACTLMIQLYLNREKFWPYFEKRGITLKTFWDHIHVITWFTLISLWKSFVLGIFAYTFIKSMQSDTLSATSLTKDQQEVILKNFFQGVLFIEGVSLLIVVVISYWLSRKLSGGIHTLDRFYKTGKLISRRGDFYTKTIESLTKK
jgi:lipoprotein signal peptidase